MAPCKRLILLTLLLTLFFFTAPATTALSFGVMESIRHEPADKGHDAKFEPREGGAPPEEEEIGDLGVIDYTPPQKKTPIHN